MLLLFIFSFSLTLAQQKSNPGIPDSSKPDSLQFSGKIIVGYGTQKKEENTGSIAHVKSGEFNKGYINDPIQLIQGRVAGLSISKPGGDPNGSFDVRLRGLNTLQGNTLPLVVVDGIIGVSLDNVDPADIESFTVLKDGTASIYGMRGSNGVIIVTTKRGKPGRAVIEYNVYGSVEKVAKNSPAMSYDEWKALSEETGLGTDFGSKTDWFDEIEQTALSQAHNISISGATPTTSYRASINYRQGDGVLINTGYSQLGGRINFTQKALKERLTIDMNLGATERESKYGFDYAFRYASIYNPTAPVKSSDPEYVKFDGYFQQLIFDYYNPVSMLELNKNEGKTKMLDISIKGTYEIISGLAVDVFYAYMSNANLKGVYYDKNDFWGGYWRNGLASRSEDNASSRLFEVTGHWNTSIGSSLYLTALGGYSYQDFTNEGFTAEGGDFLTDDFTFHNLSAALDFKNGKGTVTSYKNSNRLAAFFGRVTLDLNSILFFSASARYEGSSRLGTNNKWGLFPSVGAALELANILNTSSIQGLKFRMNYGVTGNQPSESYMSLPRLGPMGNVYYNGSYIPGYSPVNNPNPDLTWEKTAVFDMGLDLSLFKSRLSGSLDYYTQKSSDLLYGYNVAIPPNLYSYSWINMGKIKSRGLELILTVDAVKRSKFSWSFSLIHSNIVENTLVSLSGNYNGTYLNFTSQYLGYMGSPGPCGCTGFAKVEEGEPIGQIWTYVFKEVDENGYLVMEDINTDGSEYPTMDDMAHTGDGFPRRQLGIGNSFTYKNWDLSIFFRGVFGHDIINSYRALYEAPVMIYSYNLPKTATDMRNSETNTLMKQSNFPSSLHVENGSFLSLDNVSAGYNFHLPAGSAFSKIRIYLAGNNLFYINKYKGSDPNPRYTDIAPELGTYNNPLVPGFDRTNTWARTRSLTLGANVAF